MAIEFRYIAFSQEEFLNAVASMLCKQNPKFDPNDIRSVEPKEAENGEVSAVVTLHQAAGGRIIMVRDVDLQGAMLLYCRSRRIPLPIRAGKRLEVLNGGLAMVATITERSDGLQVDRVAVRASLQAAAARAKAAYSKSTPKPPVIRPQHGQSQEGQG